MTTAKRQPMPLASRRRFVKHLTRNATIVFSFIAFSLGLGTVGYHWILHLPWLDAALNASMILTGMGPIDGYHSDGAKLFGIFYTLFSGVAFLTSAAVLISPIAVRFLHRFHLDLYGDG